MISMCKHLKVVCEIMEISMPFRPSYYVDISAQWAQVYFAFSVRSLFGEVAIHCMVRDPGPCGLIYFVSSRELFENWKWSYEIAQFEMQK